MLSLGSVLRPRTFTLGLFVAISGVVYFLGVLSQCRMYDLWDIDGVWCGSTVRYSHTISIFIIGGRSG